MKNKALSLLAVLLLVGAALASAQPARAQVPTPVALAPGASLTWNNMTFTVSACTFKDPSVTRSTTCGASADNFYLAADPSGPSNSVIIEALNGGPTGTPTAIFSYTCGTVGGCTSSSTYDLSATLTVTPTTGTISSAVQTLYASGAGDPSTDGHATETINPASNPSMSPSLCQLTSNLGSSPQSCTFAPQASLSVKKDLGISVSSVADGSTLALNSVVETFSHAPEPSSIAMMVPALLMLGWACRRKTQH